jgi:hypothetical protein
MHGNNYNLKIFSYSFQPYFYSLMSYTIGIVRNKTSDLATETKHFFIISCYYTSLIKSSVTNSIDVKEILHQSYYPLRKSENI